MTLGEAIAHAEGGGRATCDGLPAGAVLKGVAIPCAYCQDGQYTSLPGNACENCMNTGLTDGTLLLRVVFEATGDGFNFTDRLREQCEAMTWRKVEGWVSYG